MLIAEKTCAETFFLGRELASSVMTLALDLCGLAAPRPFVRGRFYLLRDALTTNHLRTRAQPWLIRSIGLAAQLTPVPTETQIVRRCRRPMEWWPCSLLH